MDERPGFDRMRRDAAQGAFDVILATNADRLSRRLSGWPALYDEVAPHGVDLVTIDDGVDSRGAGGAIIGSIRSAIAADERERIRQRTTRGRAAALAEGRWVTSTAPFGYQRIRATTGRGWLLAPDPREREIVTFIFARLVRDGSHPSRVTGELGERGWTQRSGLPWTPVSLRDWARRPHTIDIAAGRTRTDAVWQQWEPLLPAHHVQQWRDWRESSYRPQNARGPYLLAGMVVMPCGNNGLGRTAGTRQSTYSCRQYLAAKRGGVKHAECRNVSVNWLDATVREHVRDVLSGRLELVIRAQTADTSAGSVEDAQDRLAALDERIGETLATLLREGMPAAAAARAVADMRRDREIAAAELARLHRHAYTADAAPKLVKALLSRARQALHTHDDRTWRRVLEALSTQVTIHGYVTCDACGGAGAQTGSPLRDGHRGPGKGRIAPIPQPCPHCLRMRRVPVIDIAIDEPVALAVRDALSA